MNVDRTRPHRRTFERQLVGTAMMILLAGALVACQGSTPSDRSPDASTKGNGGATESTDNASESEAPSTDESTEASRNPSSDYLPIQLRQLEGRWLVMGQPEDEAPRIVYEFRADGSFTVHRDGELSQQGEYEAAGGRGVRLNVRDVDTGETAELTLRLATRRGETHFAFDVYRDAKRLNTLWLARLVPEDANDGQ